jgi:hypothetical protein
MGPKRVRRVAGVVTVPSGGIFLEIELALLQHEPLQEALDQVLEPRKELS